MLEQALIIFIDKRRAEKKRSGHARLLRLGLITFDFDHVHCLTLHVTCIDNSTTTSGRCLICTVRGAVRVAARVAEVDEPWRMDDSRSGNSW